MDLRELWSLAKDSVSAWIDDYAPSMGAALAYYTAFSIAPLLIIVIAIAGFFFGEEAARGQLFGQLKGLLGEEGAVALQGLVESANKPVEGAFAAITGLVVLLVGATAIFGELQSALDRIWDVPRKERPSGLWGMLRTRILSFGMVVGVSFLLLVSLVISAVLSAIGDWWSGAFGGWELLLQMVNFAVSIAVYTAVFALVYKVLPSTDVAWRDVWIGAFVTAVLFAIGKTLIGLYIGKSGLASGFGAAGSFVVLLVWVYYSAQIFLLGAEFTWLYAHRHGSRREEAPAAERRPEPRPAMDNALARPGYSAPSSAPAAVLGLCQIGALAIVAFTLGRLSRE